MSEAPYISIVSPVYGAEKIVDELVRRIEEEVSKITPRYEIILVEDCSPDDSWEAITRVAATNKNVKAVRFSRNFGQHVAIKSGLEIASGDCAIVMDCDLQDDPVYIHELVKKWQEGNETVFTYKEKRSHSFFKNFTARLFNVFFNYLVDKESGKSDKNVGSYSLVSRKVIDAFMKNNDYRFHYLMVLRWLGFKQAYVKIEHRERFEGKSSYSFRKLLDHAIVAIVYQSDKLLRLSIYLGFLMSFLSVAFVIWVIIQYFTSGLLQGWASTMVLLSFSTGVILIAIGVMGLYIGKMFEQVKNRPQYVIDKKLNL